MNPHAQYSSVATCTNLSGAGIAIQNFAETVTPNAKANNEMIELRKKPEVIDECADSTESFDLEKQRLQNLLIELMK